MKTTVERTCGHSETVEVFGSREQRERKIWAYEQHECTECKLKKETANCEAIETIEEETILVADIQKDFIENKASESAKKVMHAIADSKQIKKEDFGKLKPALLSIDGSLKIKNENELADMVIKIVNEGK